MLLSMDQLFGARVGEYTRAFSLYGTYDNNRNVIFPVSSATFLAFYFLFVQLTNIRKKTKEKIVVLFNSAMYSIDRSILFGYLAHAIEWTIQILYLFEKFVVLVATVINVTISTTGPWKM